jgi:Tol biopolymer transport system component
MSAHATQAELSMTRRFLTTTSLALFVVGFPIGAGRAQARKSGAPEEHLPPNITQLTAFGERPAWSPDGARIAFMGKSFGDAFEIDLRTHLVRLLTGHFAHAGFLRVQFLPNGDYLLLGARTFRDIQSTRYEDSEIWVMKADLSAPPVALGQKIHEGIAISRSRMRIAWSSSHQQYPDIFQPGESALYVADVVYDAGTPKLSNKHEIIRARQPDCTIEAQDFRHDDAELVYSCYRENGEKADVMGVDLRTKAVTTFRKVRDEYNEAEGVSPDGAWVLVESSHDQGASQRQTFRYIDIWRLALETNGRDFTRLTRFSEYEGRKAANPVASPDGKSFAFQAGRSSDPPGVGYGVFLYRF